jgi:hypothetical protein
MTHVFLVCLLPGSFDPATRQCAFVKVHFGPFENVVRFAGTIDSVGQSISGVYDAGTVLLKKKERATPVEPPPLPLVALDSNSAQIESKVERVSLPAPSSPPAALPRFFVSRGADGSALAGPNGESEPRAARSEEDTDLCKVCFDKKIDCVL